MAHKKAEVLQGMAGIMLGRRLGVKKFGGEHVLAGNIIIR